MYALRKNGKKGRKIIAIMILEGWQQRWPQWKKNLSIFLYVFRQHLISSRILGVHYAAASDYFGWWWVHIISTASCLTAAQLVRFLFPLWRWHWRSNEPNASTTPTTLVALTLKLVWKLMYARCFQKGLKISLVNVWNLMLNHYSTFFDANMRYKNCQEQFFHYLILN